MEKFLLNFLGTIDVPTYLAGLALALIGAILSLRLHVESRDKYSRNTPPHFSFWFMLQDNAQRLFTGLLIAFVAFRFTNELLNMQYTMWLAFLIGFLNDKVAGLISKIQIKARKNEDKF